MVKTIRGREIDIQALRIKHQKMKTVGNANINVRGDLLDNNGKVVKTREELAQEYNRKNSNAVKNVAVSQSITKTMKTEDDKIVAGKAEHAKTKKKSKTEE